MSGEQDIKAILSESGRPERAEHDWALFCQTYKKELGRSVPVDEPVVRSLAMIFGRSLFLTQALVKDLRMAPRLFRSEFVRKEKPFPRFLEELMAAVEPVQEDRASAARVLRHYRYEETLRLTVREVAGLASLETLGRERSHLAMACLQVAYRVVLNELIREYGRPLDSPSVDSTFCVLGMGKLGGGDLNYSSDIDLIYCYSSDEGGFDGAVEGADITHHQFFVRLGEILARLLSEKTGDGFVYRVDLNLRPEGRKGTLANSIDAMEDYYESFGDNWERMALIKALPVAGSASLGEALCRRVRPFVYPRFTDLGLLRQQGDLKVKIEQSLQNRLIGGADPKSPGYNVKLGYGGIREIEFLVGSLQRLYGGGDHQLRVRHTLTALRNLAARELIRPEDQEALETAYLFLRGVENRLQMIEDRQTHTLPKKTPELEAVVGGSADRFMEQLLRHTHNVRRIWDQFLSRT